MNIIIVDGLWGSGKAFVFKSIISQLECVAIPFQDGILDMFSKQGKSTLSTKKIPINDILSNYNNIVSSSSFVFPSGHVQDEVLSISSNIDIDYETLFAQKSFSLNEYIAKVFPDLDATYVCMGNGGCFNIGNFSVPNVNFIIIHVDRSAYTCLKNLLSRSSIEQSPATKRWEERSYFWYFLRGYHALALFKNFMLRNACDIHIKWGDLSKKSIYVLDRKIAFTSPNDPENQISLWLYLLAFVQLPSLVIRLLLRKH